MSNKYDQVFRGGASWIDNKQNNPIHGVVNLLQKIENFIAVTY